MFSGSGFFGSCSFFIEKVCKKFAQWKIVCIFAITIKQDNMKAYEINVYSIDQVSGQEQLSSRYVFNRREQADNFAKDVRRIHKDATYIEMNLLEYGRNLDDIEETEFIKTL